MIPVCKQIIFLTERFRASLIDDYMRLFVFSRGNPDPDILLVWIDFITGTKALKHIGFIVFFYLKFAGGNGSIGKSVGWWLTIHIVPADHQPLTFIYRFERNIFIIISLNISQHSLFPTVHVIRQIINICLIVIQASDYALLIDTVFLEKILIKRRRNPPASCRINIVLVFFVQWIQPPH